MPLLLKRGDHIRIRCRGDTEWTEGFVALASTNYNSLAIMLNGAVRAGDGLMAIILPLTREPDSDRFIGVMTSDEYELERIEGIERNANDPPEPNL